MQMPILVPPMLEALFSFARQFSKMCPPFQAFQLDATGHDTSRVALPCYACYRRLSTIKR